MPPTDPSYPQVPASLTELEIETLQLWRDEDLFRRSMDWTKDGDPWVFYEGPPTANGRPGLHHILARTTKDLFCRFRTMQGHSVTRIAGWDTHGLPVEIEAERKLGISGKPDIERVGIERFNEVCRESVWTYKEEWESLSERIGYWLDYDRPYVTYETPYIESVWAILKEIADKGLIYRGYKSVPYCPRCGTALSSHEVAQGYKDVEDPSLYFVAPILDETGVPDGRRFVVWTTTPWTVPANTALAVHPDLEYAEVETEDGPTLVAQARVEALFGEDAVVLGVHRGADLVGLRYQRPLALIPVPEGSENAWRVYAEDFVTDSDGTGIVHLAPAFGADDYASGQRHDLPLIRPIDDEARFLDSVPEVGGQFVKDADARLVELLAEGGMLFRSEPYTHSYPHCWRCQSPLIYMARDSWFAATSSLKDVLLDNNDTINWHPPEVGEGRFGEWLRGNVDWALSRDRYWGTPLPVWVCDGCEKTQWVGSLAELAEHAGPLPEGFDPHRPFIDRLTWSCECGGTFVRSPAVIDVWFDSGAMPYAQWHYPFENQDEFAQHFPADFICEAMDQTRGWFYSLLAVGTLLGRGSPYRNVVVNGLILDADGLKMSKTRGNAVDPWEAIESYGADGVRWYLMTVSLPWADKRYDPQAVGEASRRFFDTLFNTYRFLTLYAGTEAWAASDADPELEDRPLMDRWLAGRLDTLVRSVTDDLTAYRITPAYRAVQTFVDEDLSNWYVRRSRSRFWNSDDPNDQKAAFRTLWDALRTVALLIAPVTPFVGDWLHRALADDSAHLTSFPGASENARADAAVDAEMDAVRALSRLGRAAREEVKIRVRQPLRSLQAVTPGGVRPRAELLDVLADELNVKTVSFLSTSEGLVTVHARPNYRALGARYRKSTEAAATAIRALEPAALRAYANGDRIEIEVDGVPAALEPGDLEVVEEAGGGLAVQSDQGYTAALDPEMDDELEREGLGRELVNRIQRLRRDADLDISDRIVLDIEGPEDVVVAGGAYEDFIAGETLAVKLNFALAGAAPSAEQEPTYAKEVDIDGRSVTIRLWRSAP